MRLAVAVLSIVFGLSLGSAADAAEGRQSSFFDVPIGMQTSPGQQITGLVPLGGAVSVSQIGQPVLKLEVSGPGTLQALYANGTQEVWTVRQDRRDEETFDVVAQSDGKFLFLRRVIFQKEIGSQ
jgi:hypothetical protein